jgi:hypothetical protein
MKWFASTQRHIGTFRLTGLFGPNGLFGRTRLLRNLWDGIDTYAAMLAELRW